jgi:hypothetical protein
MFDDEQYDGMPSMTIGRIPTMREGQAFPQWARDVPTMIAAPIPGVRSVLHFDNTLADQR